MTCEALVILWQEWKHSPPGTPANSVSCFGLNGCNDFDHAAYAELFAIWCVQATSVFRTRRARSSYLHFAFAFLRRWSIGGSVKGERKCCSQPLAVGQKARTRAVSPAHPWCSLAGTCCWEEDRLVWIGSKRLCLICIVGTLLPGSQTQTRPDPTRGPSCGWPDCFHFNASLHLH